MSAYAQSIQFLLSQVRRAAGSLEDGTVTAYAAGTTNLKTIWLDRGKQTEAANPYTLDSNGTAALFGDGVYRFVIKTSAGVTVYDRDYIAIKDVPDVLGYEVSPGGSLATSIAAIGTSPATLAYRESQTLGGNLTVPSNIELQPLDGATINTTGYTLTINSGTAFFPNGQVFSGTGTVVGLDRSRPEWFGVNGTNDGPALRSAIASTDGPVELSQQYVVQLDKNITLEGGATVCSLIAKSNMHLKGAPGKAAIKLADNQSTDASPKYFNLIASNAVLDNVVIEDVVFDLNGQNNKISPNRGSGTYNLFNTAAFIVSGSTATVGQDARITNFKFLRNTVKNTPGVSCVVLGQTNSSGSVLGYNVEIAHNLFYNNGIDTDDHSTIYAWAENVNIHDNTFLHPSMSDGTEGPLVAAELHGARNSFTNNDVYNYYQGLWIAGNTTNLAYSQTITDNRFYVAVRGMGQFVETSTEPGIKDVVITGNQIHITNDYPSTDPGPKEGIGLSPSYGGDGATVVGNQITSSDTARAVYGIRVGVTFPTRFSKNITIANNTLSGFPVGMQIGTASGGQVDELLIASNNITDVLTTTAVPTVTLGVSVLGKNGRIKIQNNSVSTRSGTLYSGIYTDTPAAGTGTMTDLHMDGNSISNATFLKIWDNSSVINRTGAQALDRTSLPTSGVWNLGDRIVSSAGLVGQPKAWQCTTAGGAKSTTRANTTAYAIGAWALWTTGTTVWECTTAGTSAGAAPSIVGKVVGDTVTDGTVVWIMRSLTTAAFTSEGNL